jgi:transposase-like protein
MDAQDHHIIHGGYNIREGGKDLISFYRYLTAHGLHPESATVDGNTQQIKYLYAQWPLITIQRCVVHVQRQGLSWCRRTPKRTDAKHLRRLFLMLTDVHTEAQVNKFLHQVDVWEQRFGSSLSSSLNRGKVFGDVLRARSMLLKALPNLFHYVSNKDIVRSTNALEGYFSRLKEHYRRHRGLSLNHRTGYFQWYFHLVPK